MKFRQSVLLFLITTLTLLLTACGGGGGSTPAPPVVVISVAFGTTAPTSLAVSTSTSVSAVVSNDSKNAGVTWTVTCSSSPCGTFSPTSTASGTATNYTAPGAVPSPATVTITATSVSDTTKSASATITITAPAAPISVAFSPQPPTSLVTGASTNLTAVVSNDSKNGGVNWTVTCGSSPCGAFSPAATASGTATSYTAPATVPTPATVTIVATSVTDTSKTASVTISITGGPPPPISVAFGLQAPASLGISATASLTAVVSNDSKNGGVTWTVACGTSPCGSFNSTTTASGTATVYTAPATIPTPNTVTITATSVTDTTKSISVTVTITQILADGTYVFNITGQDATGPYFVVGAISVASGVITGGNQDFSNASIFSTDPILMAGSSITRAGGNIQIVLTTGNNQIGVGGMETLRATMVSSSRALISQFDTYTGATGSLDLQTTTAAPSGGYAFAVWGEDIANSGIALGIGGVLNINGNGLSTGNSVFDYNDGGVFGQAQSFASGTISIPDNFGRVTFTLTPSTASGIPAFVLTGYIVNANKIELVESQADSLGGDLGGTALSQGSNTGNFSSAMLANTSYVFSGLGADSNNLLTIGGKFSFNASSALSGQIALNDLSIFGVNPISGTYNVAPTGRVTLTNVLDQPVSATFAFQLYLDGNGNALFISVDNLEVTQGMAYKQTAQSADFEGSYALAGQGVLATNGEPSWGAVGPVTVSSDVFSGYTDYTVEASTPTPTVALSGTETNSTGVLSLAGLNSVSFTTAAGYSYFPIDSSRVLAIETDGQQLGVLSLEGVSH